MDSGPLEEPKLHNLHSGVAALSNASRFAQSGYGKKCHAEVFLRLCMHVSGEQMF
jgi:hypothetical protein